MERSFVYKRGNINYSIDGEGDILMLIHGFGEDKEVFDQQVSFLKDHCCVITPNLPGTGNSSILPGENVSIVDYADCIYALLQHEKISKCIMIGHSMGGYVTLAFAEKHPEILNAFGLLHSTAFADSTERKEMRRKGIEVMKEYGAYAFLKNTTPNLFSADFKQKKPGTVAALVEKGDQFTREAIIQYFKAMMNRPDKTSVLRDSNVPVLFIIGTEDAAAPLNDLLQQVHLPKISQINILENVGHMGMIETAAKVNEHILEFISIAQS